MNTARVYYEVMHQVRERYRG